METSKLGYANASVLSNSVAPQRKNNMDVQAPRTAVFVRAVPALTPQPPPTQEKPPPAPQDPTTLHLTVAPLFSSKQTIPFLTFQVGGGLQLQPSVGPPTAKPKSSGKHVCRHCGRDCMKPSVLEKHLRCHTGERPYPCATCGISFKTQSNLYKHKRTQAHARLSFESGSLRASSSSSCGDLSRDGSADESGSQDRDAGGLPTPVAGSADASRDRSEWAPGGNTAGSALQQAEVSIGVLPVKERKEANSLGKDTEPPEADTEKAGENDDEKAKENQKPAPTSNRHVPLQRQEAARFSKRWESSASRGKSQSHDSTDSGFSESSEQLWSSSPGSALPGYSMESLTESCMELGNASDRTPHGNAEPSRAGQEPKTAVSVQEQQTLEERISKLISENDAVVDDKHLENVRPRKTVLSKQGSIDLPVPYTYKDSFHFEMKTAAGLARRTPDRGGRLGLHSSVPTQPSTSVEHAPLTRSSSLPFGVTLLRSERSAPASQNDPVAPARRGSSGHVHSGDGVGGKCADQQVSNHRPLVRQAAVDCVTATEGPARNLSVEEALAGGPSLDGESVEACGESSGRKSGKKKTQKFAYSKWYMYGGGTFKKMYSTTQSCDNVALKTRKSLTNLDREKDQGIQRRLSSAHKDPMTATGTSTDSPALSSATTCSTSCMPANPPSVTGLNQTAGLFYSPCAPHKPPLTRSFSLSTMQSSSIASPDSHKKDIAIQNMFEKVVYKEHSDLVSQGPIPSERKKQRTENATMCPLGTQIESTTSKTLTQSFPPIAGTGSGRPQLHGNVNFSFDWPRHLTPSTGTVSSPCILNSNGTYGGVSTVSSNSSAKAKTTFLPKYQLKLPNAMETESVALPSILNQTTGTGHPGLMTTPEFSSNIYRPSTTATPSTLSNQQCITPMLSPLGATHRMNIPAVCPAQGAVAPAPPVTVTHQSLSLTSVTGPGFNVVSDGPRLRERHFAITKTTASLLANPTTALQPIRPARHSLTERDSAHGPLTTPSPASGQQSPSGSAHNQCPPLSFTPEAASSHHTHPGGSGKSGSRDPTSPCHIVPFSDSAQPATPNIFHVRTADLQICLQIISDEQLALIEPHIERHGVACDGSLLSRKGRDARERAETNAAPEIPKVGNAAVAGESSIQDSSSEWTGLEKQTETADFPASRDAENIANAPTVLFPQTGSGTRVKEHGDVSPVEKRLGWPANAMRTGPDGRDPPLPWLQPQILTGGSEQTSLTTGGVASLTASREGEKLQRNQVTVMEDVLSRRTPPEQPLWPKEESVGQKGTFPETLSGQSKLCLVAVASLSPALQAQSSSGSKSLRLVGQHKPLNHEATCDTGTLKTGREASDHEARSSERTVNGERGRSRQAWPGARSLIEGCGGPSSKPPLLFNNNSLGVERGTPRSPERAVTERAGQPLPLAGMILKERDRSTPNHMDNPLGQITSEPDSGLEEKPKDGTAVLETHQGKAETAGVTGGPPTGCAARTEPETPASTGTPPQPDAPDKELTEGRREGAGTDGESDNRVRSGAQKDPVLGQREGESARDGGGECHFNSGLAERDPSHFFPGHTILFGSPQKQAWWDASPSDSLRCPKSGTCTAFNGARPEIETDCVHVLQRPGHSETQEESSLLQISRVFSRAEAGDAQTPPLCVRSEASSNPNHRQTEDQGSTVVPTVNPLPQGSPPMCYNNSISLSEQQRPASPLPGARAPPSSLLPQPARCERDSCRATGSSQADDDGVPTAQFDLFQPCISMDPGQDDKAERLREAAPVHTAPVGDPVRPCGSDRYPSLLSTDQLYGCQFAGCQTVGVRLVQGGHDDSDVASSSDDEGKLIIEL